MQLYFPTNFYWLHSFSANTVCCYGLLPHVQRAVCCLSNTTAILTYTVFSIFTSKLYCIFYMLLWAAYLGATHCVLPVHLSNTTAIISLVVNFTAYSNMLWAAHLGATRCVLLVQHYGHHGGLGQARPQVRPHVRQAGLRTLVGQTKFNHISLSKWIFKVGWALPWDAKEFENI